MSYTERTLTLGDVELTGQFRRDDGAARFEGSFTLAKGDVLVDEDGATWLVHRVRQADVARKQAPYVWAELRAPVIEEGVEAAPVVEPVAPVPEVVEPEDELDEEAEAEEQPEPAPAKKARAKKAATEGESE